MRPNPVCDVVRAATGHDKALLAFSCGKDSWAAWLSAREDLDFQPFYLYRIPGLDFAEEYLAYAERVIGRRIVRLPHPAFFRQMKKAVFQPPERLRTIVGAQLEAWSYDDMAAAVVEDCGLPEDCWTASGIRAADNPVRRVALTRNKGINENRRQFYPCWDWNKERLIRELKRAGVRLPVDYLLFGRSFDGLDLRFLIKIKEHHPADYLKILDWFPLVDMEIARYEFSKRK